MSKKYLGKVAFGGALAGAALFVATPGMASASTTPSAGGGEHKENHGFIKTFPKWVPPGDEVKIIEVCSEELDYPKVWSKATGKVELEPWRPPHDGMDAAADDAAPGTENGRIRDQADGQKGHDGYGKDERGKRDEHGKDHGKEHYAYVGEAYVKEDVHPGWYKLRGECGHGTIKVVREVPINTPSGAVDAGDGGLTGADTNLAAGGAAALGAAAFGGVFMVRRRRTDGAHV